MHEKVKKQFTGRTEKFLFDKLLTDGFLKLNFVYGCYSNVDVARAFLVKLETHDLATVHPETGTVTLKGGIE